jgi:hypothetical protein
MEFITFPFPLPVSYYFMALRLIGSAAIIAGLIYGAGSPHGRFWHQR